MLLVAGFVLLSEQQVRKLEGIILKSHFLALFHVMFTLCQLLDVRVSQREDRNKKKTNSTHEITNFLF